MNEQPIWRIWPLLLLAFSLQTTLLARLEIWGVHFDLPLLVLISVALLCGWRVGMAFGLACGLVMGYIVAKNPGSFAFSLMITGALCGLADRDAWRDHPLTPPLLAALATLFCDLILLLMAPTDFPLSWWLHHTLVRILVNALLIWPLHFALSKLLRPPSRSMFA